MKINGKSAVVISALLAAGTLAANNNTVKADTISQNKGQIPESNLETKTVNTDLQQKQVQLKSQNTAAENQVQTAAKANTTQSENKPGVDVPNAQAINKDVVVNYKTDYNVATWTKPMGEVNGSVQNNQQLHITHQVEHNNNNWYQMQNKSWLPSSYTTDVKQEQSVQAKQNVQNAQPVQNSNTQTQAQSQNNWHKESADFVTGGVINLRTAPNTNSAIIEAMPTGSTIKYDAYQKIGQYTWLRQPREDGSYGYIVGRNNGVAWGTFKESTTKPAQSQSNWHKESADFVTGGVINLRTAPNTNSAIIETMPTGSTIKYDAYQKIGQYTWLRQPRENGSYGYIVGRDNGVAWGTFKESATKPVESKPVTKPVESKPATKPVDSKPATKPVENEPATKPVENKDNVGIIKLPAGYTREMIEESSGGKDGFDESKNRLTPLAKKLSEEGIKLNGKYITDSVYQDNRPINLTNITKSQEQELTNFALNTINYVRKQMGLTPYVYSEGAQSVANDVAKNYVKDGKTAENGHDYKAIGEAMKANPALNNFTKGISIDENSGNPIENLGGWDNNRYVHVSANTSTMGEVKERICYVIQQMLFGGYYNGVREMYHARSLTQPVTTPLGAKFGFSISKLSNNAIVAAHIITFSGFDGYDEFAPDFN